MIDNLRENFRINLLKLLSETGKKQIDVAKYVGVSTATVAEWCKGRKAPRLDKMHKIAEFFGIDTNELLSARVPEYSPDYLTLIELYSRLDDKGKQAVMSLARTLAE